MACLDAALRQAYVTSVAHVSRLTCGARHVSRLTCGARPVSRLTCGTRRVSWRLDAALRQATGPAWVQSRARAHAGCDVR